MPVQLRTLKFSPPIIFINNPITAIQPSEDVINLPIIIIRLLPPAKKSKRFIAASHNAHEATIIILIKHLPLAPAITQFCICPYIYPRRYIGNHYQQAAVNIALHNHL